MHYAERPLIGISRCLPGHKVRYGGTGKRDRWIVDRSGKYIDYREEVPLIVPMKLLRHYFRRNPDDAIDKQWYLDPCPESLGLRNAI